MRDGVNFLLSSRKSSSRHTSNPQISGCSAAQLSFHRAASYSCGAATPLHTSASQLGAHALPEGHSGPPNLPELLLACDGEGGDGQSLYHTSLYSPYVCGGARGASMPHHVHALDAADAAGMSGAQLESSFSGAGGPTKPSAASAAVMATGEVFGNGPNGLISHTSSASASTVESRALTIALAIADQMGELRPNSPFDTAAATAQQPQSLALTGEVNARLAAAVSGRLRLYSSCGAGSVGGGNTGSGAIMCGGSHHDRRAQPRHASQGPADWSGGGVDARRCPSASEARPQQRQRRRSFQLEALGLPQLLKTTGSMNARAAARLCVSHHGPVRHSMSVGQLDQPATSSTAGMAGRTQRRAPCRSATVGKGGSLYHTTHAAAIMVGDHVGGGPTHYPSRHVGGSYSYHGGSAYYSGCSNSLPRDSNVGEAVALSFFGTRRRASSAAMAGEGGALGVGGDAAAPQDLNAGRRG